MEGIHGPTALIAIPTCGQKPLPHELPTFPQTDLYPMNESADAHPTPPISAALSTNGGLNVKTTGGTHVEKVTVDTPGHISTTNQGKLTSTPTNTLDEHPASTNSSSELMPPAGFSGGSGQKEI